MAAIKKYTFLDLVRIDGFHMIYILGTAQLGAAYGINNANGKPTEEEAFSILSLAHKNGITCIDTASSYGGSEELIGEFIKQSGLRFDICTKYSSKGSLSIELERSLEALNTERIYLYYLHKFEDCKNATIMQELISQKKSGIISNIGISVYTPDELDYIVDELANRIDIIQIPFSIIDCSRWVEPIKKACRNGIKIYCRSIFLQGAIFKPADNSFIKAHKAEKHINYINSLCTKYRCGIDRLAFNFCNSFDGIDGVIFGCETKHQLTQNIEAQKSIVQIDSSTINETINTMKDVTSDFIDPRLWEM